MDRVLGKRFLICHSIVHDLIGSTIITLDLAAHLQESGAEVLVYATFIGDPAMSLFAARSVRVVDDEAMASVSFADFDYVWVNSQVLPEVMVDQLRAPLPEPMPSFIFLHMSAIHFAPDEHPYIHQLEERLSSLSLFVSSSGRRNLMPYFEREMTTDLYPNPTPIEFAARPYEGSSAPRRVLVVSNHATPELMMAKELLRERGLEVRHVGASGDEQVLVTAKVLDGQDVVITIGKTVQYCLVAGRPVYIYDHFGGYGYLGDDNFDHARDWNFSGREGNPRTAEQIASEVVSGFEDAVAFHARRREAFVQSYSIESMVPRVLASLEHREIVPFETSYHHMVRSAQSFGARFFHFWGHNANEVRNRSALTIDLAGVRNEVEGVRGELAFARAEVVDLHNEVERLRATWTFRVGRVIVRPVSAVVRALKSVLPDRTSAARGDDQGGVGVDQHLDRGETVVGEPPLAHEVDLTVDDRRPEG